MMMDDGNIGIFGLFGYGKLVAVIIFLMNFVEGYMLKEFYMYIFDFGNGMFLLLVKFLYIVDYFLMD